MLRRAVGGLLRATLIASLTFGCAENSPGSGDRLSSAPLPNLHEQVLHRDVDAAPAGGPIVGSASGQVGYRAKLASGQQLVVIDSLGRVVAERGAMGEGPGEVRIPAPLFLDESELRVVDMAGMRVTSWSLLGDSVAVTQLSEMILPQIEQGGRWVGVEPTREGTFVPVSASDRSDPDWQPIPRTDPLVDSLLTAADGRGQKPGLGLWSHGFIIADGVSYRIAVLDSTGRVVRRHSRTLPPNLPSDVEVERELTRLRGLRTAGRPRYDAAKLGAIADSLHTTPRPWFEWHPGSSVAAIDAADRLWLPITRGDSVALDVFDQDGFVGRHEIACPAFWGSWALNGHWLALVCAPRDTTLPVDGELRLFWIEG